MKRKFPQPHYKRNSKSHILFYIPNLDKIKDSDPIFTENKYIRYYITIDIRIIIFHIDFW